MPNVPHEVTSYFLPPKTHRSQGKQRLTVRRDDRSKLMQKAATETTDMRHRRKSLLRLFQQPSKPKVSADRSRWFCKWSFSGPLRNFNKFCFFWREQNGFVALWKPFKGLRLETLKWLRGSEGICEAFDFCTIMICGHAPSSMLELAVLYFIYQTFTTNTWCLNALF